jgi:hypothetical protein
VLEIISVNFDITDQSSDTGEKVVIKLDSPSVMCRF